MDGMGSASFHVIRTLCPKDKGHTEKYANGIKGARVD